MLLAGTAAGVVVAAIAVPVPVASAAVAPGSHARAWRGRTFYASPARRAAETHGQLISDQPETVSLGASAPGVQAWALTYSTEDALGAADVATGTALVPTASWTGLGSRPVVDYAPGTQGLGQSCAPSRQLVTGTEYETPNIVALLNQGWAVVITDYQGYTAGSPSLYTVGPAEGHAVLDAATAADQIPGIGLSSSAPTAIWGYSQGGQAAGWAGQLQPSYDPSMNLVGVAAGGIPANLKATAEYLNGGPTAAFAAMSIIGLSDQYPSAINLAKLENAKGAAAVAAIKGQCVFTSLLQFEHANLDSYTKNGETLGQLLARPAIAKAVAAQELGKTPITVPVYQYQGQADEAVPLAQDIALKQQYCTQGVTDEFVVYPGEHITTMFQATPQVIAWLTNRFVPLIGTHDAPSDCGDTTPPPASTATPKTGDWDVALKQWPLNASVHLNTLDATVPMPSSSTFSGVTDLTSQKLEKGVVSIPTFSTTIEVYGAIPLNITMELVQQGPAAGSASLDSSGDLHINGSVQEVIHLTNISFEGIDVVSPTCQTVSPVTFPLTFDGPVSSLGDGQLTFSGSTTFPDLENCGALTSILNVLFPGAGQTYSFNVSPPPPVTW
jgi:Secretory lipase